MRAEVAVRPYESRDEAGVIALWGKVFEDRQPWNYPADVIARKLEVQPDLFFVAVNSERIIGSVIAGYDGVRGWVHRLAVDPDHRRQGIAATLMQAAEAGLAELGCAKLNLQVRQSNIDVVKFYEALGYAIEPIASLGKPLK